MDDNYYKYKKDVEEFKEHLQWATVARYHVELYNSITSSPKIVAGNKAAITVAKSIADPTPSPL